jgi:hypothetical protein
MHVAQSPLTPVSSRGTEGRAAAGGEIRLKLRWCLVKKKLCDEIAHATSLRCVSAQHKRESFLKPSSSTAANAIKLKDFRAQVCQEGRAGNTNREWCEIRVGKERTTKKRALKERLLETRHQSDITRSKSESSS